MSDRLYRRGDVFDGDWDVWVELGRIVEVEPDYEEASKEIRKLVYVQLADIGDLEAGRRVVDAALSNGDSDGT